MPIRAEEEPDEPDEPEPGSAMTTSPTIPAVSTGARQYEYRVDLLTVAQVSDGKTLAERLTAASSDGWDLVEIVDAGEQRAVLLRRPKRSERDRRPVGFTPLNRA